MFLRPHHFQAADRYWSEVWQTGEQWDHQYNYGIRKLELSDEAIANYQLQVNACHARMRDGTLISIDPGEELDRLDLKEAFAKESVVRVFLAVPKLKLGSVNVGPATDPGKARYVATVQAIQDESLGGNDQEVQLRSLSVRLLLWTQDLAGYETLPIAQIQRAGEREAVPLVDADYFPPMLACDAWPPLGRDVVRAIYDLIGKKIEVLSEQVTNRSITLVSQEPGDLDRLLMLSELNVAYCTLGVMAFAPGVHPLPAYIELCRIVGRLSIFAAERRRRKCPPTTTTTWADLSLGEGADRTVASRDPRLPIRTAFLRGRREGDAGYAGGEVVQRRVAVVRGGRPRRQCQRKRLSEPALPRGARLEAGQCPPGRCAVRVRRRGAAHDALGAGARALPPGRDWIYYEVSRGNAAWKDVLETQTLAMRLKDTLIVNRQELQGQRKLVVSAGGKQAALQFALFAVPNRP